MNKQPEIIVVVGPTASGKSDFAVDLALKHNGEIISADSRQVYKNLDIGTGKITEKEMKGIKHYMLSVYELDESVSVVRFARDASPILKDILKRGKTPIICGGTGQYIDALIFDTQIPQVGPNEKLRGELEKLNTEELVARLKARDSDRLSSIDHHNRPRLIRALEIVESLGKVPKQETPKLLYETKIYLLNPTREILRERITKRLEKRLAIGMLEEGEKISKLNLFDSQIKKLGLEYYSMNRYFKEEINIDQMKEEIITKSMQYAKRQQTWNRKYIGNAEVRG
ncbi:MAG: tRNA (adenosine(37)-N6)-dimethylallyltransferase MiaA [Candidatus Nomurabacteria bacterium]